MGSGEIILTVGSLQALAIATILCNLLVQKMGAKGAEIHNYSTFLISKESLG